MEPKIGIIGGSGLYEIANIKEMQSIAVDTPFGEPSGELVRGKLNNIEIIFLSRHGAGHRLLPSEINYRANIYALKKLGVTEIISVAAVGSLREEIAPLDVVMVDQFVDRTKAALEHTFFGQGIVGHISFGEPICPHLKDLVSDVAGNYFKRSEKSSSLKPGRPPQVHRNGIYLNMEGPAFSTKAESNLYRSWGMDVIGMTNLPEAKLAREAEICYCTMAMVTDYDCWHDVHDEVSVESLLAVLTQNVAAAKEILAEAIPRTKGLPECSCKNALRNAVITDPKAFPEKTRNDLAFLLDKYYPKGK